MDVPFLNTLHQLLHRVTFPEDRVNVLVSEIDMHLHDFYSVLPVNLILEKIERFLNVLVVSGSLGTNEVPHVMDHYFGIYQVRHGTNQYYAGNFGGPPQYSNVQIGRGNIGYNNPGGIVATVRSTYRSVANQPAYSNNMYQGPHGVP